MKGILIKSVKCIYGAQRGASICILLKIMHRSCARITILLFLQILTYKKIHSKYNKLCIKFIKMFFFFYLLFIYYIQIKYCGQVHFIFIYKVYLQIICIIRKYQNIFLNVKLSLLKFFYS